MAGRSTSPRRRGPRGRSQRDESFDGEPLIVKSPAELDDICAGIREQGSFAFDTEFVMEDCYRPEVCLVQLATERMTAIIDPFELTELAPVWSLVADPAVEVVVHAGMEDLALCHDQGGRTPQNVFDCQLACGLVNTDYPLSLARLTRFLLGVRLHKSQTLTDWRKRPLTEAQVHYGADDVRYLPACRRSLGRKLDRHERTDWAAEEMARFAKPDTYARGTNESVLKLKGAGGLDGQGLAIAYALVQARATLAGKYDRPARAVVRDHLLIEIARHRWTDPAQIKTLRGLNLKMSAIQQLATAVQHACDLPRDQWPTPAPPDDETEGEAALALLTGAIIRGFCADQNIAHQLVATRKDVRAFVRSIARGESTDANLAICNGWRAEHVGALVLQVLRGERRVGVKSDGKEPRVCWD